MPKHAGAQTDLLTTLAAARKTAGLTQAALAKRLHMPQAQISLIERGLVFPQLDTLTNLAAALDFQLLLVPRPLGPAVSALVTDYLTGGRSPAEPAPEERSLYQLTDEVDGGDDLEPGRTDAID